MSSLSDDPATLVNPVAIAVSIERRPERFGMTVARCIPVV